MLPGIIFTTGEIAAVGFITDASLAMSKLVDDVVLYGLPDVSFG